MSDQPTPARRDLARTPSVLWLWGAPALIAIGASVLFNTGGVSLPVAGTLWTLATAWAGLGCAVNARQCGRVHCAIDGILLPLLSMGGLLRVLGIVGFDWNAYWAAFVAIIGASFLAEIVWRRYL